MHNKHPIGLVIDGSDHFIRPIEASLRQHHRVTRFAPRFIRAPVVGTSVNKVLLSLQLSWFLRRCDVVFFEWAGSLLVQATHMPKTCRIVTRLHSFEVAATAEQVEWSRVDAAIVVSQHMRRRLQGIAKPLPLTVAVINYGVDLDRFHPAPCGVQHRIGMVCRVIPIKRVYEAILSVYDLRRQGLPFSLHVAGRLGDERSPRYPLAIQALVEKLNLSGSVTFYGHVDDPSTFYQQLDIFLSNSYWEGQQNALLEAMASGCYCLAHGWAGVEEVLPPDNVFVTDSELQQKLASYATLAQAERQRAQASMRRIAEERFDEGRMVSEITTLVEAQARS